MFYYKKTILIIILTILVFIVLYTQITFFIVQPIGAAPKGATIVMLKTGKLEFIDSADAICNRIQGKVTLLCRASILAGVARNSTIFFRLPYSDTLYQISTGGKTYSQ